MFGARITSYELYFRVIYVSQSVGFNNDDNNFQNCGSCKVLLKKKQKTNEFSPRRHRRANGQTPFHGLRNNGGNKTSFGETTPHPFSHDSPLNPQL